MKKKRNIYLIPLLSFTMLLMISCGEDNDSQPDNWEEPDYEFDFNLVSEQNIELQPGYNIEIILYGIDENNPETSPVFITGSGRSSIEADVLPMMHSFGIGGKNPEERVCDDESGCLPKFYWVALIDVDGDFQICDGDLVQDEAMTPFKTYTIDELTAETHEIYFKAKTDGSCDDLEYSEPSESHFLNIRLVSNQEIPFMSSTAVYFFLYGFDQSSSQPTYIPSMPYVFDTYDMQLPHIWSLGLDDEPEFDVCEDHEGNVPCQARYFPAAYIDLNKDGRICNGDLIQDYELTPFESYPFEELRDNIGEDIIEIHLKVKADNPEVCFPTFEPPELPF